MSETPIAPRVVEALHYGITPERISAHARQVVGRLQDAGYTAHLVGGCIRDLALGHAPKDFDVVTEARPEEIRLVFRNARLIGRRFRLAHVQFGREIIEVATYRAAPAADVGDGDNVFGTIDEDARRRDFTVNALYYDPVEGLIRDYVGGLADLEARVLRVIGDPEERFREDPVRMLRAVRFAVRLQFELAQHDDRLLARLGPLLQDIPPARLFEEVLKLFQAGNALANYQALCQHHLFGALFPASAAYVDRAHREKSVLVQALASTDQRIAEGKAVTPAFLFAALLWDPVHEGATRLIADGAAPAEAWQRAAEETLQAQLKIIAVPKRFSVPMREIWSLQSRFERRGGRQAFRFLESKRFRAAYDFLGLRARAGGADEALFDWWTRFQEIDDKERQTLVEALSEQPEKRKRRRRRSSRSR
ncbi:MAG: polynucleotide adenylyltransferase PcnB [Gammaproteobacteria bacterium]|nr:polynucleotide adenylyltransferase PcnB [Gammaproteobacteria bacterium]